MRSAGCILNDMADRNIDPHVKRTKNRPLASKQVSMKAAMILLATLLLLALAILLQLPKPCILYALVSVALTVIYPFCKRFFAAPQLVLGLAFSMGIPMAYAASGIPQTYTTLLIFTLNFLWIVAYDTIYAMADREDDLKIGVRSTAILFAPYDKCIILLLHTSMQALWLVLAYVHTFNLSFYFAWGLASLVLMHQQRLIRTKNNPDYLHAFSSNGLYGLIFWVALMLQT